MIFYTSLDSVLLQLFYCNDFDLVLVLALAHLRMPVLALALLRTPDKHFPDSSCASNSTNSCFLKNQILAKAVRFIVSALARLTPGQYSCSASQFKLENFRKCFNTPDLTSRRIISTSFSHSSMAHVLQLCTTDYITNRLKIRW